MHIKYKKSNLRFKLVLGLMWLIFGILSFWFEDSTFSKYIFIVVGLIYLSFYLYHKKYHYLKIEQGVLTEISLFPKQIHLSDITEINTFAGDITLTTDTTKLVIYKDLIEPNSYRELNDLIQRLEIQKTV